jgi:nucleotidyltransferase/DNA polymerase involved in DNA repair
VTGLPEPLESIWRQVQAELHQKTGIPVGIGIATTKTLVKLSNNAAKRWQKQTGVVDIRDPVLKACKLSSPGGWHTHARAPASDSVNRRRHAIAADT